MGLSDWFSDNFPAYPPGGAQPNIAPKRKPRLAAVNRAPSREEWDAWRDNPITLFLMAALARNAEEYRDEWVKLSWETGRADQAELNALRVRADTLKGIAEADYTAFCDVLRLEPNEEERSNG